MVAQFEFIPWILGQCASVKEALRLLEQVNLVNTPFSESLPLAQLHWILADREEAVTVESVLSGIHVYPNPAGVLTNNPPFPEQMFNLNNYMHLSPKDPENCFSDKLSLKTYCRAWAHWACPETYPPSPSFVRVSLCKAEFRIGRF